MKQNQEKLYPVQFIQYFRPNGKPKPATIDRPREVFRKAVAIIEAGYRLEAEVLIGGLVSLTVGNDEGDYAAEIHFNGPGLEDAVDRLILGFEIGGRP